MDSIVFKKKSYSIEKVIKEENDCSIFLISDEADKFLIKKFSSYSDTLDEVFENREQIEISRFYEKMPKASLLATEEFVEDKVYFRNPAKEDVEE